MHQDKSKRKASNDTWRYFLIKSLHFACKIDIQIRLIQSMEIYDAPEKRADSVPLRDLLGLTNQFPTSDLWPTCLLFPSFCFLFIMW